MRIIDLIGLGGDVLKFSAVIVILALAIWGIAYQYIYKTVMYGKKKCPYGRRFLVVFNVREWRRRKGHPSGLRRMSFLIGRALPELFFDSAGRKAFFRDYNAFPDIVVTDESRVGVCVDTVSGEHFRTDRIHELDVMGIQDGHIAAAPDPCLI